MKFLEYWLRRKSTEHHAWLRDPENWKGVCELPQVALPARLVVVPSEDVDEKCSYVGGDPYLPPNVAWPTDDETPMAFVMQINCTELPRELWGGIGPRQGYLSIFMAWDSAKPMVVFHKLRGVLRPHPETPEPQWRRLGIKGPKAGLRIEAWPSAYAEHGTMKTCPDTCFEHAEQMMPLTWAHAVTLLEKLADSMGRKSFISKRKPARPSYGRRADSPLRPGQEITREAELEKKALLRSAVASVLKLMRFARKKPQKDILTNLNRVQISDALAKIEAPSGGWTELRSGRSITGYRVEYADLESRNPQTLGELLKLYADRARLWAKLSENAAKACWSINASLDWCTSAIDYSPPASVPDYDRVELERVTQVLRAELKIMKSFEDTAKEWDEWHAIVKKRLDTAAGGGFTVRDERAVPKELLETVRELRAVGKAEVTRYLLSDEFYGITKTDCTLAPVLDANGCGLTRWKQDWHETTALLALEDSMLLPESIRARFMIWLRARLARKPHQMGGVPDGRLALHKPWFDSGHYVHAREREAWLSNADVGTRVYYSYCEPPFDKENTLLLNLYSDDILDWHWGEGYTIVVAMPREALRVGDWTQIKASITN